MDLAQTATIGLSASRRFDVKAAYAAYWLCQTLAAVQNRLDEIEEPDFDTRQLIKDVKKASDYMERVEHFIACLENENLIEEEL